MSLVCTIEELIVSSWLDAEPRFDNLVVKVVNNDAYAGGSHTGGSSVGAAIVWLVLNT